MIRQYTTFDIAIFNHCSLPVQAVLPECLVIPFGATLSGHGTLTSDCDLVLLSRPRPLDCTLFLGPAYLPTHLHGFWEVTHPVAPPPHYQWSEGVEGGEPVLEKALAVLEADNSFSAIRALRSARVPVIKFTSDQVHCDLSFNNRWAMLWCATLWCATLWCATLWCATLWCAMLWWV